MTGNELDLLVIGEGLSGITAAASAAARGLHVMLVSKGPGSFVLGPACIDIDGVGPRGAGLAVYDGKQLDEGIAFFLELTKAAGCGYSGDLWERRLVPTIMGTFQEVSLAPNSLWKGDPRGLASVQIAGIGDLSSFDACFLAERFSSQARQLGLSTSYRGVVVQLPESRRHAVTTVEVASRLDREPSYRRALIASLRAVIGRADLLILPGILGLKSSDDDIRQFEKDIGCAVCELATLPPVVPALRLLRRLERRLTALGVDLCTGFAVKELCLEQDRCTAVLLDTPGRPRVICPGSVVLACGRFAHLLEGHASGGQPEVNQALQPLNRQGAVIASNVFTCGSAIGKMEPRYGNAMAIMTGYQAAIQASERGVQYAGR